MQPSNVVLFFILSVLALISREDAHAHIEAALSVEGSEYFADRNVEHRKLQETGRLEVFVAQTATNDMMDIDKRDAQLGNIGLDGVMLYKTVWDLDYKRTIKPYLDKGYKVVVCLEFVDRLDTNLAEIGDGLYDIQLLAFAKDILTGGKEVEIRPMHEFNGNWYSWCTFNGNNTKAKFIRAWKHLVDLFRAVGAPVRWQLNYNNNNYANLNDPFSDWYPGDDYVDIVCISGYNRVGVANSDQLKWMDFEDVVKNAYNSIVKMTNKPVCIGETGTSNANGMKAQWITDAFTTIVEKYTHITEITWFLFNKEKDGNWDLNTDAEIKAFSDGVIYARETAVEPYDSGISNYEIYNAPNDLLIIGLGNNFEETLAPTFAPTSAPTFTPTMMDTPSPTFINFMKKFKKY